MACKSDLVQRIKRDLRETLEKIPDGFYEDYEVAIKNHTELVLHTSIEDIDEFHHIAYISMLATQLRPCFVSAIDRSNVLSSQTSTPQKTEGICYAESESTGLLNQIGRSTVDICAHCMQIRPEYNYDILVENELIEMILTAPINYKPSRVFGIFSSLIDTSWRFKGILYENLHSLQHLIKGSNSIAKLLERIFSAFGSNDDLSAALRFLNELTELRPEENELRDPFTLKFIRAFQNLELGSRLRSLSDATTTLLSQNNQEMLYKVMKRLRVERAPDLPSYLNDTLDSLEIKESSLSKSFDYCNEISSPDSAMADVGSSQYRETVDKNSSDLAEQIASQKLMLRHNGSRNTLKRVNTIGTVGGPDKKVEVAGDSPNLLKKSKTLSTKKVTESNNAVKKALELMNLRDSGKRQQNIGIYDAGLRRDFDISNTIFQKFREFELEKVINFEFLDHYKERKSGISVSQKQDKKMEPTNAIFSEKRRIFLEMSYTLIKKSKINLHDIFEGGIAVKKAVVNKLLDLLPTKSELTALKKLKDSCKSSQCHAGDNICPLNDFEIAMIEIESYKRAKQYLECLQLIKSFDSMCLNLESTAVALATCSKQLEESHFLQTLWQFALICCNYLSPRKRIVTFNVENLAAFAFENRSSMLKEFLVIYRKNFDSLQPDNSIFEVLKNLEDLTAIGMVDIDSSFRSIQEKLTILDEEIESRKIEARHVSFLEVNREQMLEKRSVVERKLDIADKTYKGLLHFYAQDDDIPIFKFFSNIREVFAIGKGHWLKIKADKA
ncbi:MAG: hypothetical protein MHMPM18_001851 [Marteilia pararefringens]